ncbi:MAG: decaprenyl-phosphate phosphoribosyltransferase [Candidatus Omnitrophica bacterium]|nr:decaprenyl-phosphate phosphoribosyltransferase [Candidatus Omnitrophota bacterium]MBU1926138.1 decaprenyl-phosphate phosphoribosyltransferase [Candidatus Omnitrophota bacterium]
MTAKIFIQNALLSMRPRQWVKNLFIFAALIFSQNLFNISLFIKTVSAGILFCLISSCAYIINDLTDKKDDKFHPFKSKRPLVSGELNNFHAIILVALLTPVVLTLSYKLNFNFFVAITAYFLLQLFYSFLLKHAVILDVFSLAFGFVLRVVAGALIIDVKISSWLLICTLLLTLFLALCKRRHELISLNEKAVRHRKSLRYYSPHLLDQMISIVTASTFISYILYTRSQETIQKFQTEALIFTTPFVLYGIFRYLYLVYKEDGGGAPDNIFLTDKALLINSIFWLISVYIILYF